MARGESTALRILPAAHLDVQCLANLSEKAIASSPVVFPMNHLALVGETPFMQIEGKAGGALRGHHK